MTTGTTFRLDGAIAGLAIKAPCKVQSTANLTLSGVQTVNSIAVVAGDRVLVKDQTTGTENGIYTVSTTAWTRALDFDGNRDVTQGTICPVYSGSGTYKLYAVSNANPITIDTTSITFEEIDSATLRTDLANTSDTSLGDALIGVKLDATGAVATNQHAKNENLPMRSDFGSDADFDTAVAAIASPQLSALQSKIVQAGTGAVAEALQSRGRWEIYVSDYLSDADRALLRAGTEVDITTAVANAFAAAGGATPVGGQGIIVKFPAGNCLITATRTLPKCAHILGSSRRGVGNPGSMIGGTGIRASFAGPVFQAAPGSITSYDLLIEGLTIRGDKATYPTGNGVTLTNVSGVEMHNCVVANFGAHNIAFVGGYAGIFTEVYSAQAGDSNFYIDGEKCALNKCTADGGLYSVRSTTNGYELDIEGGVYEGATTEIIRLLGVRSHVIGAHVYPTTGGANGIYVGASRIGLSNNEIKGISSTIGIDIPAGALEYSVIGNRVSSFATALRVKEGSGSVTGNVLEGQTTGVEATSGSYMGIIADNWISGGTDSINHVSGDLFTYNGNVLKDDDGTTDRNITITGGAPQGSDVVNAWTPTVVPSAGAITTYTSSGTYTKIGREVTITALVSITNNGTGSGSLNITNLPFTVGSGTAAFAGKEDAATGFAVVGHANNAATILRMAMYDGTYPGATGNAIYITGSFLT